MRRSNFVIKLISFALFIVVACYMGYALYDAYVNEFRTSAVYTVTIEDSLSVSGYVVRDEYIIDGGEAGGSVALAGDGEKVAKGQPVAASHADASFLSLRDELSELEARKEYMEHILAGDDGEESIMSYITELSYAVSRGDVAGAWEILPDIEAAVLKTYDGMTADELRAEISSVNAQIAEINSRLSSGASYIYAAETGVFSSVTDGYEYLTTADMNNLSVAAYERLFGQEPAESPNAAGKIITGITWYYAVMLDNESAAKLEAGGTCDIFFEDVRSEPVTMEVQSVSYDDAGRRVAVFSSNKNLAEFADARELSGKILFDSYDGIRVAKSAVYTDEDGTTYLYILRILQAKRVDVNILSEEEDYYIIENDGSIPESAEIIVKANDLYDGKVVQ